MFRKICAVLLAIALLTSPVYAHITNSDNIYTDIAKSDAKDDILFVQTLHLISTPTGSSSLFKPDELLTREDFASWYGAYKGYKEEGDTLLSKLVDEQILKETHGHVTYDEVNHTLFYNEATVENGNEEIARGEYATFIAKNAEKKFNSQPSLLEEADFLEGPTGKIEKVVLDENYILTINGKDYELSEHPRINNDSVDPLVWQEQYVEFSLLSKSTAGDHEGHHQESEEVQIQYVKIVNEANTQTEREITGESTNQQPSTKVEKEEEQFSSDLTQENDNYSILIWSVVGFVLILLVIGFVVQKRTKGKSR